MDTTAALMRRVCRLSYGDTSVAMVMTYNLLVRDHNLVFYIERMGDRKALVLLMVGDTHTHTHTHTHTQSECCSGYMK